MLARKVLCLAMLYGSLRLYAGWEGYFVARLYGCPRLYADWEDSLCSQALWWPETVCWLGRFFV